MSPSQLDRAKLAFATPAILKLGCGIGRPNSHCFSRRNAYRTAKFRMTAADAPDAPPSKPEAWEVTLPAPPVPEEPVDLSLGAATGVVSVSETAPVTTDSWLQSVLDARNPLGEDNPLSQLRAQADTELPNLPIPSRRMESWRFTDLRPMYACRYVPAALVDRRALRDFDVRKYAPDTAGVVLVFVDGVYDESLSIINDDSAKEWLQEGGYFGNAQGYKGESAEVQQILSSGELQASGEEGLFPTIANAIAPDAAILRVPQNFAVPRPVAIVFVSSAGESVERAQVSAARLAVIAEPGSKLVLLESHVSLDMEGSFATTMAITGVKVKDNATVKHYLVNDCFEEAHLMASSHAEVSSGGTYELRNFGLGSQVGRLTAGVDLNGSGSHGVVYGVLVASDQQVADIHSRITHNARSTTSDQLQKNVAAENGRTIFRGKIIVTPKGEQTDSSQLCKSLLLSDKATVDAMPVLEIATDDVKCSHGATVSDLEEDQLFYCQARGIGYKEAQYLILSGFALDVLGDCPFPSIREQVEAKVDRVAGKALKSDRGRGELTSI